MKLDRQSKINNAWGDPIIYNEVKIYPIRMKDALDFYECITCLTINKNSIPDPQVIRMSYLEFIITMSQNENYKQLYDNLIKLLYLVFQKQLFYITTNEKNKLVIKILTNLESIEKYNKLVTVYEEIQKKDSYDINVIQEKYDIQNKMNAFLMDNSITLTGKDFDKIRKIILKQNLIKFDDELVNAEVKKALEEAQEFISKKNGDKQATLDELIISYGCDICTGKPQDYKDIKDLTIFQFYKGLQRISLSKQQEMLSTALGMGGISMKDMPNWLDHVPETDTYDDVILNDEDVKKLKNLDK